MDGEAQKVRVELVAGMPLNVTCRMVQVYMLERYLEEHPGLTLVYYNEKTKTLYVPQE